MGKHLVLLAALILVSCGKNQDEILAEGGRIIPPAPEQICDTQDCQVQQGLNFLRDGVAPPVVVSNQACKLMALEQAQDMVTYNYVGHDRPAQPGRPAETFRSRLRRFNLLSGWTTEIFGFSNRIDQLFLDWSNDPAALEVIQNPNFTAFGIGIFQNQAVLCLTSLSDPE
jgi:uncharacterized protein YkwD